MDKRIIRVVLILSIALLVSGCAEIPSMEHVERTRVVMNTDVVITVMHPDVPEAESAINCAFAEVYGIEHLMSHTTNGSEVAELNENSFIGNASPELYYVIGKSHKCSELSNGSFDITVLPVIDLWMTRIRAGSPPTSDEINETLKLVNYKNISIENDGIYFSHQPMGITLGGVAKGYAVDRAIEVLREHNVHHAIVNAGGDIRQKTIRGELLYKIPATKPSISPLSTSKTCLSRPAGIMSGISAKRRGHRISSIQRPGMLRMIC